MTDAQQVFVRRGGDRGGPVLVLVHGLGATAEVWDGLTALLPGAWPGPWLAVDLPGHGRSAPLARYSFGGFAAALAPVVPAGPPVAILGHSLGGAVALALGSGWFGIRPTVVAGLGIKVRWTDDELTNAAEMASRPVKVFADRDQAADRALRVAGLVGWHPADSPFAHAAVVAVDGGYRLALDPGVFAVGAPDIEGLLGACRATALLGAGEHDSMSPGEHLRGLVPEPFALAGLGHNAHVEDPAALLPVVQLLYDASK